MRKPSEILELAISLLEEDEEHNRFMCIHLAWMHDHGHISICEERNTRKVVMAAIYPWHSLAAHLQDKGVLARGELSDSPGFSVHQLKHYIDLIIKLKQENM